MTELGTQDTGRRPRGAEEKSAGCRVQGVQGGGGWAMGMGDEHAGKDDDPRIRIKTKCAPGGGPGRTGQRRAISEQLYITKYHDDDDNCCDTTTTEDKVRGLRGEE